MLGHILITGTDIKDTILDISTLVYKINVRQMSAVRKFILIIWFLEDSRIDTGFFSSTNVNIFLFEKRTMLHWNKMKIKATHTGSKMYKKEIKLNIYMAYLSMFKENIITVYAFDLFCWLFLCFFVLFFCALLLYFILFWLYEFQYHNSIINQIYFDTTLTSDLIIKLFPTVLLIYYI